MSKQLTEYEKDRIRAELNWWQSIADISGLRPMFTHYYRWHPVHDKEGRERLWKKYGATTCVLILGDQVVARGAAVVSGNDNPFKMEGRLRSLRRAMTAYIIHIPDLQRISRQDVKGIDAPLYLSELEPKLTSVEAFRIENMKLTPEKTAVG